MPVKMKMFLFMVAKRISLWKKDTQLKNNGISWIGKNREE